MSYHHTTITIPAERAEQLRTIAKSYHPKPITVSEVIEGFINDAIAAGRLADVLPGFTADVADAHVFIVFGTFGLPPVEPAIARFIANLFEAATLAKAGKGFPPLTLDDGFVVKIARHGRGVALSGEYEPEDERHVWGLTLGMARDFARIIRKAADRAEAKHASS